MPALTSSNRSSPTPSNTAWLQRRVTNLENRISTPSYAYRDDVTSRDLTALTSTENMETTRQLEIWMLASPIARRTIPHLWNTDLSINPPRESGRIAPPPSPTRLSWTQSLPQTTNPLSSLTRRSRVSQERNSRRLQLLTSILSPIRGSQTPKWTVGR